MEDQQKRLADFHLEQEEIKKRAADRHAEEKTLREEQVTRLQVRELPRWWKNQISARLPRVSIRRRFSTCSEDSVPTCTCVFTFCSHLDRKRIMLSRLRLEVMYQTSTDQKPRLLSIVNQAGTQDVSQNQTSTGDSIMLPDANDLTRKRHNYCRLGKP